MATDDETDMILAALELIQDIEQDRCRVLVAACGDDSGSVSRDEQQETDRHVAGR